MRIIYLEGFGAEERLHYKDIIYSNVLTSMRVLIQGAKKFGLTLSDACQAPAQLILDTESTNNHVITAAVAADLKLLWNDSAIKKAYDRQNELQLYDSTS